MIWATGDKIFLIHMPQLGARVMDFPVAAPFQATNHSTFFLTALTFLVTEVSKLATTKIFLCLKSPHRLQKKWLLAGQWASGQQDRLPGPRRSTPRAPTPQTFSSSWPSAQNTGQTDHPEHCGASPFCRKRTPTSRPRWTHRSVEPLPNWSPARQPKINFY